MNTLVDQGLDFQNALRVRIVFRKRRRGGAVAITLNYFRRIHRAEFGISMSASNVSPREDNSMFQ